MKLATLKALRWIADRELVILLSLLVIVGGTWSYVELAGRVVNQETQEFDEWIIKSMRRGDGLPIGPAWLTEMGRDMTALGGWAVLVLVTFTVAGFLSLSRKKGAMWTLLIAAISGVIMTHLLKDLVDRSRPNVVEHLSHVSTSSFPSGHSMMSAVVYLTLGTLLAGVFPRRKQKLYILTVALLLTGLVGVSRVFMGVHFPSDVLAGWTAGLVWATLCWMIVRKLQQRGSIESVLEDDD
jgi:undecaprenyl-diphosphatase